MMMFQNIVSHESSTTSPSPDGNRQSITGRNWVRKIALFGLAGCCLILVGSALINRFWQNWQHAPVNSAMGVVTVDIPQGSSGNRIGQLLRNARLMPSAHHFLLLCKLNGVQRDLKAGQYEFSGDNTPAEILDIIRRGRVRTWSLMIPEGWSIAQIDDKLHALGRADAGRFAAACANPHLLTEFHIPSTLAEGYLFPATYQFEHGADIFSIARKTLQTFFQRLPENFDAQANLVGLDRHRAIIMASIIEKETALAEERRLISAVFHNRLKKKMRLQTDPTVIYALEDFDGNLRKHDLSIDSPYNTYRYPGLPPGPICNPGTAALLAAVQPATADYLYFVAKGDGSHAFSVNLTEHNQAVARYQKRSRGRPPARNPSGATPDR